MALARLLTPTPDYTLRYLSSDQSGPSNGELSQVFRTDPLARPNWLGSDRVDRAGRRHRLDLRVCRPTAGPSRVSRSRQAGRHRWASNADRLSGNRLADRGLRGGARHQWFAGLDISP